MYPLSTTGRLALWRLLERRPCGFGSEALKTSSQRIVVVGARAPHVELVLDGDKLVWLDVAHLLRLARRGVKSDERLPFGSLFFAGDFDHPLSEGDADIWKTPLQMVRRASSATNKQPWRAVAQDGCVHFFERKTRGYAKDGADIQKVDLGTAGEIRRISQPRRTLFSPSSYLTKPPACSIHSYPVSVRAHPKVVIITMVEVSTPSCPMLRAMM